MLWKRGRLASLRNFWIFGASRLILFAALGIERLGRGCEIPEIVRNNFTHTGRK